MKNYFEKILQCDHDAILYGIQHGVLCEKVNAIVKGTQANIHDDEFIQEVALMAQSDETLMHIRVASFAEAALDILGVKKYNGADKLTNELIECGMNY